VRSLRSRVHAAGLDGSVEFLGRLSTDEKHERMARAHVLLMASVREGWGLSIAEANACGTPAIVYDVHGLRDAVRDGITGLIVPPSPDRMAGAMSHLTNGVGDYGRIRAEAMRWAGEFSFDSAAEEMRAAVTRTISKR